MISEILKKYLPLTKEEEEKLNKIAFALVEKNKSVNLTALTEPEDVAMLHFYDSLTLCDGEVLAKDDKKKIIDVGCGAGFPSLPLSVFCPECEFTLLDSTKKKLELANELSQMLGLNLKTVAARAEEISHDTRYRERFDVATARGVARLNVLCEWALPFVKVGGILAAMKGSQGELEAKEAENAIRLLGGRIECVKEKKIPLSEHTHTIIVIRKERPTPKDYPRENRKIKKKPL